MTFRIEADQTRRALETMLEPGQVTELRCLNARVQGDRRSGTYSGYFAAEHVDQLIEALERVEQATGCYFVPNPVKPDLLARSYNKARMIGRDPLTSDHDILCRKWLLVDVDPVRPAGVSATDAEKEAASRIATDIDCQFSEWGFPPGLIGDSGNGSHLMVPIDLPADDGGKVEKLLKRLAAEFNTDAAKVDTTVHNPSRIWKLPGTMTCKGDHCPEIGREHRMAKITTVCTEVD